MFRSASRFSPRLYLALIPALVCCGFFAVQAAEQYQVEASLSGGSIGNLYSDSTEQSDTYLAASLDIDLIPVSFGKLNLLSEYTYYTDQIRLSNIMYGGGFTLLPLSDSSRWIVYLDANIRDREYRGTHNNSSRINANEFTGAEYDGTFALGYDLAENWQLRAGVKIDLTEYGVKGVIDKKITESFLGANTTLFGRVACDIELGYGGGKFQRINPWVTVFGTIVPLPRVRPENAYDPLFEDDIRSGYISARLSTSLGHRTGVALTGSLRRFDALDDSTLIYGYSTGFLSPWVNEHEGQGISVSLKTFLLPRLITQLQIGYWERSYIKMVEREIISDSFGNDIDVVDVRLARERSDCRRRVNLTLKMPLSHSRTWFMEPSLSLDYTDNSSSIPAYDYGNFQISGGVMARF